MQDLYASPPRALSSAFGGRGVGLLEEPTYRLYHCRRCGAQVQICQQCDRGNIYCAGECSQLARREGVRRAGARYQRTLRGARRHAERQRHYRAHCQSARNRDPRSARNIDPCVVRC